MIILKKFMMLFDTLYLIWAISYLFYIYNRHDHLDMKREAGGQGEFSVGKIFGAATSPIFGRQYFLVNFRI
jgi:hypothetical protein